MAITFDNIAGGELAEKFKMALAQIGRNILDPNMDSKAARGMTINLKFNPSPGGIIKIEFDIKTKLAGFEKAETTFLDEDLELLLKAAGNIEKKNNQSYSDDGVSQVATMTVGVAQKADVIVPNPVKLIPYRTFQEVEQPASQFVFRIGDNEVPTFMIVEAQNQIWKNEAVENIKNFFIAALRDMPQDIRERIAIIG